MPLFRASAEHGGAKADRRRVRKMKCGGKTGEDESVPSLTHLCLLSLADNMKDVWAKDYADKYLDQYSFRHIMGPFNLLPGELVEDLILLLCARKQLSRAALHLLLVPQLRGLSLQSCPGLVTSALCAHIAARCQDLWSLDLSGAQQLSSKVLSETLCSLPALRSLSLAGMTCDRRVIRTIARHCHRLSHLDVSHCHFLSPAALLPLGGGAFCSSTANPSSSSCCCTSTSQLPVSSFSSEPYSCSLSPLPLSSILALDIAFGEQEGDPVVAAAYILLLLPGLKRVAMEGLDQACWLIEHRDFSQADEFSDREGVPRLHEVWKERRQRQDMDGWRQKREGAAVDKAQEDEEDVLWEGYCGQMDDDVSRDEGPSCSLNQADEKFSDEHLILHLKDIKGITCDFLDSLGHLCPDICSISVNADTSGRNQGTLLAAGLQFWSGQLQSLSVLFPRPMEELLPAVQVAGSSLVSLTLEGVKTSPHTPLLEVIIACPRLRDLQISADPPTIPQWEDEVDPWDDQDLPLLPNLRSLKLSFSYSHSETRPDMFWMSLTKGLRCLLTGSPLLEKLSLVSLPCPLNCVLQEVLRTGVFNQHPHADSADFSSLPLGRVQHMDLLRTDVKMATVKNIMQRSRRLKFVDLSYCWHITQVEWLNCKMFRDIKVVWV